MSDVPPDPIPATSLETAAQTPIASSRVGAILDDLIPLVEGRAPDNDVRVSGDIANAVVGYLEGLGLRDETPESLIKEAATRMAGYLAEGNPQGRAPRRGDQVSNAYRLSGASSLLSRWETKRVKGAKRS